MSGPIATGPVYATSATTDLPLFSIVEPAFNHPGGAQAILVWPATTSTSTYARIIDATGAMIGSDALLPNPAVRKIVGLDGGGFLGMWHSNTTREVRFQRFASDLTAADSETLVASIASGTFEGVHGIALDGGGFVVVYDVRNDAATWSVMARTYDATGTATGAAVEIDGVLSGARAYDSRAVRLTNGNYVITWAQLIGTNPAVSRFRIFATNGAAVTTKVSYATSIFLAFPKGLFPLNGGGFAMLRGSGSPRTIFIYDADGVQVGGNRTLTTITTSNFTPNTAFIARSGELISGYANGVDAHVNVRKFIDDGTSYVESIPPTVALTGVAADAFSFNGFVLGSLTNGSVGFSGSFDTAYDPDAYTTAYQVFNPMAAPAASGPKLRLIWFT